MFLQKKLDRTTIKYIAVIAMLIDHIAMFYLGDIPVLYVIMRFIGRITAPVMCFFLVEGYLHTSSIKRYGARLAIVGIISQVPYSYAKYGDFFAINFNMIITLFACFVILVVYDRIENEWLKWFIIGVIFIFSFSCEWGVVAPLWVLIFYTQKYNTRKLTFSYAGVTLGLIIISAVYFAFNNDVWYREIWQIGLLIFVPMYYMYSGEEGTKNLFSKWSFYLIYPLQFVVICLFSLI